MTQITYPNASTNTFAYNADGQRVQRTDSTGTTKFIYDGARLIAETDANNNITVAYGYIMALARIERGAVKRYPHFDGQGSTRQLTDTAQAITDTYDFDAFGNLLSSSGTSVNPFKYVGNLIYHTDSDSGLMLLGLRYYDATVGRFITGDPARAEANAYAYARNNPVNRVDPMGTCSGMVPGGDNYTPPIDAPIAPRPPIIDIGLITIGGDPFPGFGSGGRNPCDGDLSVPVNCQDCCDAKLIERFKDCIKEGLKDLLRCLEGCKRNQAECIKACLIENSSGLPAPPFTYLIQIKTYLECCYSGCFTSGFNPPGKCSFPDCPE